MSKQKENSIVKDVILTFVTGGWWLVILFIRYLKHNSR